MKSLLNVQVHETSERAEPAPTLVFAHGYGCDQSMWEEVVDALPHVRRVLFDWPGVGGADPAAYDAERHAGLQGYADDLVRLLDELDLGELVFVGHSVAASIGLLAARSAPRRFAMLALVSPSPCFANDPPDYHGGFQRDQLRGLVDALAAGHQAWSRSIAPVVMGVPDRPALSDRLADSFCAMDPDIALRWARATFFCDVRAVVPAVAVPALVLQSRDDALAPVAVGRWLAQRLPTSRYIELDATGHCPHVSAPDVVAGALTAALHWRG